MKKTVTTLLALLLVFAMAFGMAACNGKDPDPTTEAPTEAPTETLAPDDTDIDTTAPIIDDTLPDDTTGNVPVDGTTLPGDSSSETVGDSSTALPGGSTATTLPGTSTATATTTTTTVTTTAAPAGPSIAPPANLGSLSKAEQLDYFNLVANNVRTVKPGFTKNFQKIISDLTFTGVVSLFQSIVDNVVSGLTGADDPETIKKGDGNDGKFLGDDFKVALRASDVTSISSVKSGDNWVMTVKIIAETNPDKKASANARAYPIASRQEVLDEITGFASVIKADVSNATLNYKNGYIKLTINSKGQVTSAEYEFIVDAVANKVSIIGIKTDVTAKMTTTTKLSGFTY